MVSQGKSRFGAIKLSKPKKKPILTLLTQVHARMNATALMIMDRSSDKGKLFRAIDKNHDGKLTLQEFIQACRELFAISEAEDSDDDLERVFHTIDEDNLSANDPSIDIDELLHFVRLPRFELKFLVRMGWDAFTAAKHAGQLPKRPKLHTAAQVYVPM